MGEITTAPNDLLDEHISSSIDRSIRSSGSYNASLNADFLTSSSRSAKSGDKTNSEQSNRLFFNFVLFSLFYSIVHGPGDAVIAFAAAELGTFIGSTGGFVIYLFYTLSALTIAKPFVSIYSAKTGVLTGLVGLLIYVCSFYIAVLLPSIAIVVFPLGAAIGGTGAGILWTAQGSYYALNTELYATAASLDHTETARNFAAIFSALYLSMETGFKVIATVIFLAYGNSGDDSWKGVVFGLYTAAAFASAVAFYAFTLPFLAEQRELELRNFSSKDPVNTTAGDTSATDNTLQETGLNISSADNAASVGDCVINGAQDSPPVVHSARRDVHFHADSLALTLLAASEDQASDHSDDPMLAHSPSASPRSPSRPLLPPLSPSCRTSRSVPRFPQQRSNVKSKLREPLSSNAHSPTENCYSSSNSSNCISTSTSPMHSLNVSRNHSDCRDDHNNNEDNSGSSGGHRGGGSSSSSLNGSSIAIKNVIAALESMSHTTAAALPAAAKPIRKIFEREELVAVLNAIRDIRRLQLLLPYQMCFGLVSGFVGSYVNGVIVRDYIGDGYIGLLTGIATLFAVVSAGPSAYITNTVPHGVWYVMIFGGVCFAFASLPVLVLSNSTIGSWDFIVIYFVVHGAARGIWENTNKAVVYEYFTDPTERVTAFAAVYFAQGIAGSFGYLFTIYLSKIPLGSVNFAVAVVAIWAFHFSYVENRRFKILEKVKVGRIHKEVGAESDAHVDSMETAGEGSTVQN